VSAVTADEAVLAAAERLALAAEPRKPCEPVRDLIGETDVARAYAVHEGSAIRWPPLPITGIMFRVRNQEAMP